MEEKIGEIHKKSSKPVKKLKLEDQDELQPI